MPEKINQLVQDIFLQIKNPVVHREVKEDPEGHLLSLLTQIKKELEGDAKYRTTLYHTVQSASYDENVREAKEEPGQPV
jgi:hypothetical protein